MAWGEPVGAAGWAGDGGVSAHSQVLGTTGVSRHRQLPLKCGHAGVLGSLRALGGGGRSR